METVTPRLALPICFFFVAGEALCVTYTVVLTLVFVCAHPNGQDIQTKAERSERNIRGLKENWKENLESEQDPIRAMY